MVVKNSYNDTTLNSLISKIDHVEQKLKTLKCMTKIFLHISDTKNRGCISKIKSWYSIKIEPKRWQLLKI